MSLRSREIEAPLLTHAVDPLLLCSKSCAQVCKPGYLLVSRGCVDCGNISPEQQVKFALVLAAIFVLAALVGLRFMRRDTADTSDDASERVSKLSLRPSLGLGDDAKDGRRRFNPIAAVVAFSRQYHQEHSAERRSTIKIILALYQVLADLSNIFRVPFPPVYTETSSEFGLSNVNFFSIEQISCATQLSYYTRVLLRTIIPLALILLLIVVGVTSRCELLPKVGLFKNQKELGGSCLTIAFVIAFLVYPSLTSVAFKMFLCVEREPRPLPMRALLT